MTDVHFYFNVPDKLPFACRLVRKAFMQGRALLVSAPQPVLQELDQMLWHMSPSDFIAHDLLPDAQGRHSSHAPVWLCADAHACHGSDTTEKDSPQTPDILLSLWDEVQPAFSRFAHVYELVLRNDQDDRQRARGRWRHYQQRGYAIQSHDLEDGHG